MLVGFSVKNYKSFKEEQRISFEASKIIRHSNHVVSFDGKRILKSGLIFGANASGKSNLISAIGFSRDIVLNGLDKVDIGKCHFRIDKGMYREPAVFEYRIRIEQSEYSYGVVIDYPDKIILSEWLAELKDKGGETYIFNREVNDGISSVESEAEFTGLEEKHKMDFFLEGFGKNITDSYKRKTILNDIALRVNETAGVFGIIKSIYEWFAGILIIYPDSKYNGLNEIASDENSKIFFSNAMSYFDTGIESIENGIKQMDFDKVLEDLPREETEKIKVAISNVAATHPVTYKVNNQVFILRKDDNGNIVYNKLLLNHGNMDDLFDYSDESDGTKRLFDLLPLLYAKDSVKVILIDEIDRSLHTKLTRRFLESFYEYLESKHCQLIATTHDSNLLDLDLLRQDEIWFVEREEDSSSKIYSLNKFKERFDKKIDKEYLLGRYGAIPVFDDKFKPKHMFEWEI